MQLYILRHGVAEDEQPGQSDADRALTADGIRELRLILQSAEQADVFPAVVLSSPLLRAQQTAEIAMDVLGCREPLVKTPALIPDSSPDDVWQEVRAYKKEEQVMVVGHEPLLSQLVAYLLSSPGLAIDLKKGAMVRIELQSFGGQPKGVLKWMLVPKLAG